MFGVVVVQLCIGAIIQPLANLGDGEEPIPIVHYPKGPLRCSKCMAYVNPFFVFIEQGNAFNCNMCGMRNDGQTQRTHARTHTKDNRSVSESTFS